MDSSGSAIIVATLFGILVLLIVAALLLTKLASWLGYAGSAAGLFSGLLGLILALRARRSRHW